MNPKYDTTFKVKDFEDEKYVLVQNASEVAQFNEEYNEDFNYYFIEFYKDCADYLFGCDALFDDSNVYYVGRL